MIIQETELHQGLPLVSPRVEFIKTLEVEKTRRGGMVLAIVGIDPSRNGENASDPQFWTVREKKSKLLTNKVAGQISFPADTRKIGEDPISNLVGALAEFTDNEVTIRNLFLMPSSLIKEPIKVDGGLADLVVVVFNGSINTPISPFDVEDVDPNRWMTREQLQREGPLHLRGVLQQAIELEPHQKISQVVDSYFRVAQHRIPLLSILPDRFSMADFFKQRERLPDVIGDNRKT